MKILQEYLFKIINNPNFMNIVSTVIATAATYLVARYKLLEPQKLKVKEARLKSVYLPLYRLIANTPEAPSIEDIIAIHKNLSDTLNAHYELAHPQLHRLNSELALKIHCKQDCSEVLDSISRNVSINYELLKNSLGYPSESVLTIFISMNFFQKYEYVLSHLNMFWFISIITSVVYSTINLKSFSLSKAMLFIHIFMIALNIIYLILNKKSLNKN